MATFELLCSSLESESRVHREVEPAFFRVNTLAILTRPPRTSLGIQSMREGEFLAENDSIGKDNFSHLLTGSGERVTLLFGKTFLHIKMYLQ